MGLSQRIKNASDKVQKRYKKEKENHIKRQIAKEKRLKDELTRLQKKKRAIKSKRRKKTERKKLEDDIRKLRKETSIIHKGIREGKKLLKELEKY